MTSGVFFSPLFCILCPLWGILSFWLLATCILWVPPEASAASVRAASEAERPLRRIQISPLPTGDSLEAETPIVCQSPSFSFYGRHRRSEASRSPVLPPAGYYVEGGRPVKAEVKLLVKTADVGREAIEIRSIREFVDLPAASGPFERVLSSAFPDSRPSSPPCASPTPPASRADLRSLRQRPRPLSPLSPRWSALGKATTAPDEAYTPQPTVSRWNWPVVH